MLAPPIAVSVVLFSWWVAGTYSIPDPSFNSKEGERFKFLPLIMVKLIDEVYDLLGEDIVSGSGPYPITIN